MDGLRSRGVEVALACPVESAIAGEAAEAGHRVITHPISGDLPDAERAGPEAGHRA